MSAIVIAFGFSPNGQLVSFLVGGFGALLAVITLLADGRRIRTEGIGRLDRGAGR